MAYTTPATWVAGDVLTAAQLNAQLRDNLNAAFPLGVGAWTAYTPTLTQGVTVTKTVTSARYQRIGQLIVVQVRLVATSAGTVGTTVQVGLPVTALGPAGMVAGNGHIYDASASTQYEGSWALISTTAVALWTDVTAANEWGTAPSIALASSDAIGALLMYEAAT